MVEGLSKALRIRPRNETQVPKFALQTERRAFGNGTNRVETECVAIVTATTNAMVLKKLMSELYPNEAMPGKWIPIGVHLKEGPEAYLKVLKKHKNYLKELTQVLVFGVRTESLWVVRTTASGRQITLRDYIRECTGAVEVTRTSRSKDLGKHNLIVKKRDLEITRSWITDQLPKVYKNYATGLEAFGDFPYPRRSLREDYSPVVGDYRTALLA